MPRQRDPFLAYFNLGTERSLERLRQEVGKMSVSVTLRTLERWSSKYNWTERVQAMDQEVTDKAEEIAIKQATAKKSDILTAVKNTMIAYNRELVRGNLIPSASDFKKMWEVMRVELGRTTGAEPEQPPAINIFLTKNQSILNIVHEAEDKLREELRAQIGRE